MSQFKIHETTVKSISLEKSIGIIILVLGNPGVAKEFFASMSVDEDVLVAAACVFIDFLMVDEEVDAAVDLLYF